MTTLDDFMPDVKRSYECCKGTNITHDEHWRFCVKCNEQTFHSFAKWNTEWDSNRTSCGKCGEPNDWLVVVKDASM
jgi:hypothetical protein